MYLSGCGAFSGWSVWRNVDMITHTQITVKELTGEIIMDVARLCPGPVFACMLTVNCMAIAVAVFVRQFRWHDTTVVAGAAEMCGHVPCP